MTDTEDRLRAAKPKVNSVQMHALTAPNQPFECEMLDFPDRDSLIIQGLVYRNWKGLPREQWLCPLTDKGRAFVKHPSWSEGDDSYLTPTERRALRTARGYD